jgi:hypothetical protein
MWKSLQTNGVLGALQGFMDIRNMTDDEIHGTSFVLWLMMYPFHGV